MENYAADDAAVTFSAYNKSFTMGDDEESTDFGTRITELTDEAFSLAFPIYDKGMGPLVTFLKSKLSPLAAEKFERVWCANNLEIQSDETVLLAAHPCAEILPECPHYYFGMLAPNLDPALLVDAKTLRGVRWFDTSAKVLRRPVVNISNGPSAEITWQEFDDGKVSRIIINPDDGRGLGIIICANSRNENIFDCLAVNTTLCPPDFLRNPKAAANAQSYYDFKAMLENLDK